MVTKVQFPVFVLTRDSGEISKYSHLEELESALEAIDIENGEYVTWDRDLREVGLAVQRQGQSWLLLSVGSPAKESFQSALSDFAASMGMSLAAREIDSENAETLLDAVVKRRGGSRVGWMQRIFRRSR